MNNEKHDMTIMHKKYCNTTTTTITVTITIITVGVTAVTPTVIVALSEHHALSPAVIDSDSKQSLQEEEERRCEAKAHDYLCF